MKSFLHLLPILALAAVLGLTGCTENARARRFGGTMNIELPAGATFINATWKDDNLWYLYKGADGVFYFVEDTKFGMLEGKVVIKETPAK